MIEEMVNSDLCPGDKARITALIKDNSDVFAWTDDQLGFTDLS